LAAERPEQLGTAARQRIMQEYTLDHAADRLTALYARLTSCRPAPAETLASNQTPFPAGEQD
jgi:hypothetical protein